MKVPLKIKIFLWFLKKAVILTKDNLAKMNWNGSKACCFCSTSETIQYLFLDCHYARFFWRAMFVLFGINPPRNTNYLFNSWSKLGGSNHNHLLLTGTAAFCWVIWITSNDMVFDKGHPKTFLQVLFRGDTLVTILDSVAAHEWLQGTGSWRLQATRIESHGVIRIAWMVLHLPSWTLVLNL